MFRTTPATRALCWRCALSSPRPLKPSIFPLKRLPRSLTPLTARRHAASSSSTTEPDLAHTRNIGIIAHIDAGKTTTTERMLYYSGHTRHLGSVDDGSTVMDYLPAERSRGITITSAAITFPWQSHTINLIDTPGHADFTFEVQRSIRVLDGAVTILDGVAGVEAQTEGVWRQAAREGVPRVVFVNKLDRVGARFGATVREVARKLGGWPAVLQLPLYERDVNGGEDALRGVVDVVDQHVFLYPPGSDGRQVDVKDYAWLSTAHPELHAEAVAARVALVELLTTHDDALVEEFLAHEDHAAIPASSLRRSLRAAVLPGDGAIIPVLCGASFRNIGVQPLLDAVVSYLPSPLDRPPPPVTHALTHGRDTPTTAVLDPTALGTVALAFKVVVDPRRGAMVYVRVYAGTLSKAAALHNTTLGTKERAQRLLRMYADDAVDIAAIPAGHIGVVLGLKTTRTGDTLTAPAAAASGKAANALKTLRLRPIPTPPPVFFASLEPHSLGSQKHLTTALSQLLREDPSLAVTTDADSGQTLLSGMGELHLEIARDRLVGEMGVKADMGAILIAYRESVAAEGEGTHAFERDGAAATVTASVVPLDPATTEGEGAAEEGGDGNEITLAALPASSLEPETVSAALTSGATAALSHGPHLSLPVRSVAVTLSVPDGTLSAATPAALATAARLATTAALAAAGPGVLIEPVMRVVVSTEEGSLGKVVSDLSSSRGGQVLSLGDAAGDGGEGEGESDAARAAREGRVWIPTTGDTEAAGGRGGAEQAERRRDVVARVPLGEMVGYLKHLRSVTGGRGTFVMELDGWERMQGARAGRVEGEIRGV
ncbi:P-loop containing nucleoside triphosphate hydrolase protein [Geopyxis carbonaria]|nr:P-loop containing nucleoside triphosphate hydrolase protein [Geopyxis carbonaria]